MTKLPQFHDDITKTYMVFFGTRGWSGYMVGFLYIDAQKKWRSLWINGCKMENHSLKATQMALSTS